MTRLPIFKAIAVLVVCISAAFSLVLTANTNANQSSKSQNTIPIKQLPKNTPKSAITSRGQLLYENHCPICHNSSIHIRESRKAHSVAEIGKWVIRWSQHLKLDWTQIEINQVTHYLNQRFYQFPESKTDTQ